MKLPLSYPPVAPQFQAKLLPWLINNICNNLAAANNWLAGGSPR
jgi:hypothetical protein